MTDTPIRSPGLRLLPGRARPHRAGPSPIVPVNSIAGNSLMIVVAIMSFLACITVGAVTLVQGSARTWQSDIRREITIQIVPGEGVNVDASIARAIDIAGATDGVAGVSVLTEEENLSLLEPWLGLGFDVAELPIPRLIVVSIRDPYAVDIDSLSAQLDSVPGASLDDHRLWTERLSSMANVSVVLGFAVLALVFSSTVLSVVFATKGAMAGNQQIVSVLHFIGAEDGFVAREFQRHFLLLGLKGGLSGAALAAVLFAVASLGAGSLDNAPQGAQISALFGSFSIGPAGYFGALFVAFAIALLTAITSRITVFRYLGAVE